MLGEGDAWQLHQLLHANAWTYDGDDEQQLYTIERHDQLRRLGFYADVTFRSFERKKPFLKVKKTNFLVLFGSVKKYCGATGGSILDWQGEWRRKIGSVALLIAAAVWFLQKPESQEEEEVICLIN